MYADHDDTLAFKFIESVGSEQFGFCSLKLLTKLMFSCVETVTFLLDFLALKTLPIFLNLAMTRENLLP